MQKSSYTKSKTFYKLYFREDSALVNVIYMAYIDHVAGGELGGLNDLAHVSWVKSHDERRRTHSIIDCQHRDLCDV